MSKGKKGQPSSVEILVKAIVDIKAKKSPTLFSCSEKKNNEK